MRNENEKKKEAIRLWSTLPIVNDIYQTSWGFVIGWEEVDDDKIEEERRWNGIFDR